MKKQNIKPPELHLNPLLRQLWRLVKPKLKEHLSRTLLYTQEVTGSSPVPPTTSPVLLQEESPVLEILEIIFGPELRRRLMVRQMSNDELFQKYQPELRLRIHNEINLKNDIVLLDKFRKFLGDSRPSPPLAKEFISGYHQRSLSTQARYAATIKGFIAGTENQLMMSRSKCRSLFLNMWKRVKSRSFSLPSGTRKAISRASNGICLS